MTYKSFLKAALFAIAVIFSHCFISCVSFTSADYPDIKKLPDQKNSGKTAVVFLAYSNSLIQELRTNHELRPYLNSYDLDLNDTLARQKKGTAGINSEIFLVRALRKQHRYLMDSESDDNGINSPWISYSVIRNLFREQKYNQVNVIPLFETLNLKGLPVWVQEIF